MMNKSNPARGTIARIITNMILLCMLVPAGLAQESRPPAQNQPQLFSGIVLDLNTDRPLQSAIITNLSTRMEVQTQEAGQFSIPARIDDLLQFYYPGYRVDTLVVIEFDLKRVYLTNTGQTFRIDEISIRTISDEQLDNEIENAQKEGQFSEYSKERGGFRLSPSRLFGHAGRQARERYELLVAEKDRRVVDRRFSISAIQALTPLKDQDLTLFMIKYRPSLEFAQNSSEETFNLYIMDSYAHFKRLSPAEKAAIVGGN